MPIPASFAPMLDAYLARTGQVPTWGKVPHNEPTAAGKGKPRNDPPKLVEPACYWRADTMMIVVPLVTRNETNQRDWKSKNRRAGAAWKALRSVVSLGDLSRFEQRLRAGGEIDVRFVRLAPCEVDRMVGLPACCKGIEDALAFLIGCDDGSASWRATCGQEKSVGYGVRIEIT